MRTNVNPYALVIFAGFLYLMNWAFESGNALAALGLNVLLCLVLWPVVGEMLKNLITKSSQLTDDRRTLTAPKGMFWEKNATVRSFVKYVVMALMTLSGVGLMNAGWLPKRRRTASHS